MRSILILLTIATLTGCATLAEYGEGQVPSIFSPQPGVILDQDHALIPYRYCIDGNCIDRISELTRFELELDDGTTIKCLAMRQYIKHVDSSVNDWIWAVEGSDVKCEDEMEKLAEED